MVSVVIASWNAKADLERCIDSVLASSYSPLEVIVVDNASTDNTPEFMEKKYGKKIRLFRLKENAFAGGARDFGWRKAKGRAVFFLDQDNELGKHCIKELSSELFSGEEIGEVGPLMLWGCAKDKVWFAGARTSLLTSRTTYVGSNEKNAGQFSKPYETDHIPNAFMLKKSALEKIGGFDLFYKMEFEESDLAMKVKEAGFKVLVVPKALDWHHTPMLSSSREKAKAGSTFSPKRAWLKARNRVYFMRKHSGKNFAAFLLVFLPLLTLAYSVMFLREGRIDAFSANIKGVFAGLSSSPKAAGKGREGL